MLTEQQCTNGWGNCQALLAWDCWWKRCRNGPRFGNLVCKRREGRVSCGDFVPHVWGMKCSGDSFVVDLGSSVLSRKKADSHSRKRFKGNKVLFWNSDVQKSSPRECFTNHMANGTYWLPCLVSANSTWPTLQPRQNWVFYKRQSNTVQSFKLLHREIEGQLDKWLYTIWVVAFCLFVCLVFLYGQNFL